MSVIGYKGFDGGLSCRGYQYTLGSTHRMDPVDVVLCQKGFHFCLCPIDVLTYYGQKNHCYAKVKADDYVCHAFDGEKSVTNQLTILEVYTSVQFEDVCTGLLQMNCRGKIWYPSEHIPDPLPILQDDQWLIYYGKGKQHRDDGPTIISATGTQVWYQNGQLHRTGAPAVIHPTGAKEWYNHGLLHRIEGPAIEGLNGHEEWYFNGQRHRVDGPALIMIDGSQEWYVNDVRRSAPYCL